MKNKLFFIISLALVVFANTIQTSDNYHKNPIGLQEDIIQQHRLINRLHLHIKNFDNRILLLKGAAIGLGIVSGASLTDPKLQLSYGSTIAAGVVAAYMESTLLIVIQEHKQGKQNLTKELSQEEKKLEDLLLKLRNPKEPTN